MHHTEGEEQLYLSAEFQSLLTQIRSTSVYNYLRERSNDLEKLDFVTFLDYFLPNLTLEMLTLVLLSMPKQVLFQLRMIKTHESDKGFWDTLIEESSTGYGN